MDLSEKYVNFKSTESEIPVINPIYLNVRCPSIPCTCSQFEILVCNQALDVLKKRPSHDICKASFEVCLRKIGYELTRDGINRFLKTAQPKISKYAKSLGKTGIQGKKKRDDFKNTWWSYTLREEEIQSFPWQTFSNIEEKLSEAESRASAVYTLLKNNKQLEEQVKVLEKNASMEHHGKAHGQVSTKQQLKQIKERSSIALWFAESFNLKPVSLTMQEKTTGESAEVMFAEHSDGTNEDKDKENKKSSYENLSEEDKKKIRTLVKILNTFSISLGGYHELTQIESSLPRTYLVEGCQKSLDQNWQEMIKPTPGPHQGAQLPFKYLLKREVEKYISTNNMNQEAIKVKISGDGTSISRANVFVNTFTILDNTRKVMKSSGNHTICVVKTSEDYETLKTSLQDVIRDVNQVNDDGYIEVEGKKIAVEMYLGGDYKFLLLALGMKSATSNNSCIYCKIHKKDRSDMSKPKSFCQSEELRRSLGSKWKKDPGCTTEPLFKIPLHRIVVDELHLLLRIMDRLETGLIHEAMDWDESDNICKPKSQWKSTHLDGVVQTIRSCGISFSYWLNKDGKMEWTSMMGNDKKKLLRCLPNKMESCVRPENVEATRSLWMNFSKLYDILSSDCPSAQEIQQFHSMAKDWGKQGKGYDQVCPITPYIHIMIYHVCDILEQEKQENIIKHVSDYIKLNWAINGVEKKNDDFRRFFYHSINKWDACKSLLTVEKRQEELVNDERKPRKYVKRNAPFWFGGGKIEVTKKIPRLSSTSSSSTS